MYTVFLIDDEEIVLKQIASSIPWLDNGFEVIGMETDACVAIEKIKELKPNVVFCDLKIPYLDGHSLMKEIRKSQLDIEFVMLSAYGTFDDARIFFKQGGFDYILKPLQLQEVQIVLEKLTRKLAKKYSDSYNKSNITEFLANEPFFELIEYVKCNFKDKITLEQLGKKFGLSAGYICNLFSKQYNTTLTCFVTKTRMEYAAKLIKTSSYSLKCIAIECGYKDYFYFNKVFKNYFGVSPSQFKDNNLTI